MARTTRSTGGTLLDAAQSQLGQSLDAINATDQKLASFLGFAGIIIALVFARSPKHLVVWGWWIARGGFVGTSLVTVYGLLLGTPAFGPIAVQAQNVKEWERARGINLAAIAGTLNALRIASLTMLVGLLALMMAIV